MPYELTYEDAGLLFRFHGDLPFKDIMNANVEAWEHPARQQNRYTIWDLTKVDKILVTEGDAQVAAEMDNIAFRTRNPTKIALIATDEDIVVLCESYAATLSIDIVEVQIFSDEESARRWVDA